MKINERGYYETLYNQSLPTFYSRGNFGQENRTPIYELQFETEKGLLTFEIDAFGYQTIPTGVKSELTYQGYELISFKDWYPVTQ